MTIGENLLKVIDTLYDWVWGAPLLILITGIGIYLTIALKGLQFRYLGYALKLVFGRRKIIRKLKEKEILAILNL